MFVEQPVSYRGLTLPLCLLCVLSSLGPAAPEEVQAVGEAAVFDLERARLAIDARGYARLDLGSGQPLWPVSTKPIVQLDTAQGTLLPDVVTAEDGRLRATFPDGAVCEFAVEPGAGFLVFEVTEFDVPEDADRLRLLSLPLPEDAEVMNTLNAARTPTHIVALSAAEPNVHAFVQSPRRRDGDRDGCSHEFMQAKEAKVGETAADFTATADEKPGGWSICGRDFPEPMDLTGCKAIRAWVHGDGKGEQLKLQLYDGRGGYRDNDSHIL